MIPMRIATRHFPLTEAEEAMITDALGGLESLADRITDCQVTVETPHRRWRQGARHHIRVDLRMPGERVVVSRQADANFMTAIQLAFAAARRQVTDVKGRRRPSGGK
jgi:ribosome-associated translation inhibitor RaiA